MRRFSCRNRLEGWSSPSRGRFLGRQRFDGTVSLTGLDVLPLCAVLSLEVPVDSVMKEPFLAIILTGSPLL
jgi:hypothetical protein